MRSLAVEKQNKKKKVVNKQTQDFKKKYFDYYDDIKSPTHKIVDW